MTSHRRTRALAGLCGSALVLTFTACASGGARAGTARAPSAAPPPSRAAPARSDAHGPSSSAAAASTAAAAPGDSVPLGYANASRHDLTGAVGTVSRRRLAQTRVARVEQLLAGRVAGVQVLPLADGGFTIRVRNATSFIGSAEPLFVIDGMPLPRGGVPGHALDGIAPQDIARIDVLKDAAAAALYGSDGANGVVLITTRRR